MADADPGLIDDLVAANRILYDQGVVDGFGHVSGRHDKTPERFLLAHSHSPAVIPFGVVATSLQPIFHMGSFLGLGVPVFEIRDAGGPATDMLIRTPALGEALAKSLGNAAVGLLRGHGNVVVGGSVK